MADAAIQTLARQMELLVQHVAALSCHLGQQAYTAPLPSYPNAITSDALDRLSHDPRLPDHLRNFADLLRIAFPMPLSNLAVAQRVDTHSVTAVQSLSNGAPPPPRAAGCDAIFCHLSGFSHPFRHAQQSGVLRHQLWTAVRYLRASTI